MAQEFNLINKKGQAVIESIFVLAITVPLILFLLHYFILQINLIALDELVEMRLICELSNEVNCQEIFENKVAELKIKNLQSKLIKKNHLFIFSLQGEQTSEIKLERILDAKKYLEKY